MPTPEPVLTGRLDPSGTGRIVNDFSIQVATVNGSGSQTANLVLLRSIFQMGVPVSGKNLFPSNIAGLPTWYTVRANRHGYIGRKKEVDILVAMNAETAREDVLALGAGAVVVYDDWLDLQSLRDDLIFYPVPFDRVAAPAVTDSRLRRLARNMVYDGVLSWLLGIDLDEMRHALRRQLARKPKALAMNLAALEAGFAFAGESLTKRDPFAVEPMNATAGMIMMDGNAAAALGCLMAGVTVVAWYPITPSSSLCETLIGYLRKYRMDPVSGKATFAVVQAEDEIAALGMVMGAGWAGARAMTATSGPGISLMAEFSGLGYFVELPGVIVDVQRAGPSTGLPTRTMQGDLASTAWLSHGDTRHVLLLPSSVQEIYEMTNSAFDLAEQLQTPVFVMSDLDLGMNMWMSPLFPYPDTLPVRGKLLTAEKLQELGSWGRYRDVDGDGIPYRTVPGDGLPAYFARGSGHNEQALYSERQGDWVRNMDRLARKFETARALVPPPEVSLDPEAHVGVIAFGTSHWGTVESRDQLRREHGIATSYLRLRAYPFTPALAAFIQRHDRVYVIEQNRDGQMLALMRAELDAPLIAKLRSVRHYDGLPLDARTITDDVLRQEGVTTAAPVAAGIASGGQ